MSHLFFATPASQESTRCSAGMSPIVALAAALLLAPTAAALAADDGIFELGTMAISASRPEVGEIASDQDTPTLYADEIQRHSRETVGDALNLMPGITLSTNSRNEQLVYLRGHDSREVPLFIDGIPVYVPYDGYVDFNRFTTSDLSAIQVSKGFSPIPAKHSKATYALASGAENVVSLPPIWAPTRAAGMPSLAPAMMKATISGYPPTSNPLPLRKADGAKIPTMRISACPSSSG